MFKMKQDFSGSFDCHCQEESVQVSLLALSSMVLYGPNITTQSSSVCMPQPAFSLSQLLRQQFGTPEGDRHYNKAYHTAKTRRHHCQSTWAS